MLSDRKKTILKLIIDEFTDTASPIGSKTLINKYNIPYSPATIRNDMSNLEEIGLLHKRHNSSGRVPSEDGYKLYVDELVNIYNSHEHGLVYDNNEKYQKDKFNLFTKLFKLLKSQRISHDIKAQQMLDIISDITECLSFYIDHGEEKSFLYSMNIVDISYNEFLAIIVDNFGRIKKKIITTNSDEENRILKKIISYCNELLKGTPLIEMEDKFDEIKHFLISKTNKKYSFYDQIKKFINEINKNVVYVSGLEKLCNIHCNDCLKESLSFFSNDSNIVKLKNSKPGIEVNIGEKISSVQLKDLSIIKLAFYMKSGLTTIGIAGNKRMQYNDVIQLFMFINKNY